MIDRLYFWPVEQNIRLEIKVRELEMPGASKLDQLGSFLVNFYQQNVISQEALKKRYDVYHKFKRLFTSLYPGSTTNLFLCVECDCCEGSVLLSLSLSVAWTDARVNIYGSTAHGACFADSSCDISIEYASESSSSSLSCSKILGDVCDVLRSTDMSDTFDPLLFKQMERNRQAKKKLSIAANKLSIQARDTTVFNFSTGLYPSAHKTSALLRAYLELDDRAKILAFVFRYIAKVRRSAY